MANTMYRSCLTIFAIALLAGCSGEKTASEYLENARSHLNSDNLGAALIETRNAVSQSPDNPEARTLLGQLELRAGNPVGAEAELQRAVQMGVQVSDLAVELAQTYLLIGKLDELESMNTSDISGSERAQVLGYQAEAALLKGEPSIARHLATEGLLADPESAVVLTALARLQLLEANIPAARTYLSTAKIKQPGHSPAWELLGDIEFDEKRLPKALNAYSRAVDTAANWFPPLFKRARTHLAMNNIELAAADLDLFKKSNVKTPSISLLKSEILLREGKIADAQIALEEGLRIAPDYQAIVRTLAVVHTLRGSLGQAEQYGKQYQEASDSDDSRILLAAIRLQANRLEQAEQTLLPLTESGRLDTLGSQVLAAVLLKQDRLDDAINTMLELHANLARSGITEMISLVIESDPASFMSAGLTGANASSSDTQPYFSDSDLMLVDAVQALAENNVTSALAYTSKLLVQRPDNADLHLLNARIHMATGNFSAASEALDKATVLGSKSGTAVILASMLKMSDGDANSAITLLEDAFSRAQGATRERLLLALTTLDANAGNEEKVLERLGRGKIENPASYQVSLALANYFSAISQPEQVLESLSKLSTTARQNHIVIDLQARAHIDLEQFDEAIALVTPVLQSESTTARWRYLRARAYSGKNDIDAVQRDLNAALRTDPGHAPSLLAKAKLSILTNDLPQAESEFTQLQGLISDSETLNQLSKQIEAAKRSTTQLPAAQSANEPPGTTPEIVNAARSLWTNGDRQEALVVLTDWLENNPDDTTIGLMLADTYTKLNQPDHATAVYQNIIETDENNHIALNNLAWQLREQDPEAAISYAIRAVQLQPNDISTLDTLAVIQLEQGMLTEAGKTFDLIRTLKPTDATILFNGARILAALGNTREAKNILEPVINSDIDFPDAVAARTLYGQL